MEEKLDKCIENICNRVIENDFAPGEYAETVKALASLVEARANYMQKKHA